MYRNTLFSIHSLLLAMVAAPHCFGSDAPTQATANATNSLDLLLEAALATEQEKITPSPITHHEKKPRGIQRIRIEKTIKKGGAKTSLNAYNQDNKQIGKINYDPSQGSICRIQTEQEFRGQGIGSLLLRHALDDMQSTGTSKKATLLAFSEAIPFYQKQGWRLREERNLPIEIANFDGERTTAQWMYIPLHK